MLALPVRAVEPDRRRGRPLQRRRQEVPLHRPIAASPAHSRARRSPAGGSWRARALAAGGIATAAFALPALGFALGPIFEDSDAEHWQEVGPEGDFNDADLRAAGDQHRAEHRRRRQDHLYVRTFDPATRQRRKAGPALRRDLHPLRPPRLPGALRPGVQKFVCPCHGGVYDFQGKVARRPAGAPARPLLHARARGQVELGDRFSLNSELERFSPRDPSNHLDGLWQYLYPSRPTT